MKEKNFTPTKVKKYGAAYWKSQITCAEERERFKQFVEAGQQSIKVYNATHTLDGAERKLNIWWQSVQTLLPAYFANIPKADVDLKKLAGGEDFQLVATLLERAIQYEMEEEFDFDYVGLSSATQFLLTGRSILKSVYKSKIEDREQEFALIVGPDGVAVDGQGKPYEGEAKLPKKAGIVKVTETGKVKVSEAGIIELVNFNDFLTSDGRNESEITWKGNIAYLCEEEAEEQFGKDIAKDLSYNSFPDEVKNKLKSDINQYDGKAKLYEIHCPEADRIFFIHLNGKKTIIESTKPEIKFEDFYPYSVINASIDPDSTEPTSDYVHCKDQIMEVERLTTRIHGMTQAIRANAAYDATLGADIEALLSGDLKMTPVRNWPSYKSRGGLASAVEYLAIQPYVQALQVLVEARMSAKAELNEALKITDLLRGASDPNKTATANRYENNWAGMGLEVRQGQFTKFISSAISKLGTIVASQFSPDHLFKIADAAGLFQAAPQVPPERCIEILRNETERCYRIEIASDSMVALDKRADREEATELIQSAGSFFQQMQGMIEQYPPLAPLAMHLFKYVIRHYKGGKELEPVFINGLATITQLAEQKQAQQAETPPTPGVIEAQARLQIAQMESQDGHQKNMLAMQEMTNKMQIAQAEMNLKAQQVGKELEIKAQELQIKLMEVQASIQASQQGMALKDKEINTRAAAEIMKGEADKRMQDIDLLIKQQQVETQKLSAQMHAWEKMQEEKRLAMVELGAVKEKEKPAPAMPKMPDVHVHIGGKTKSKVIRDKEGKIEGSESEIVD